MADYLDRVIQELRTAGRRVSLVNPFDPAWQALLIRHAQDFGDKVAARLLLRLLYYYFLHNKPVPRDLQVYGANVLMGLLEDDPKNAGAHLNLMPGPKRRGRPSKWRFRLWVALLVHSKYKEPKPLRSSLGKVGALEIVGERVAREETCSSGKRA